MLEEKCAYCGDMTDMPFECNYCKDPFCSEHRLPEDHRCVKLTQLRAKKFGEKRKIIRDGGTGKKNKFEECLAGLVSKSNFPDSFLRALPDKTTQQKVQANKMQ